MSIGVAVAVLGLLLALWLVVDIGLVGPGPMVKDAYNRLVGWGLLGCLVAVGAMLVAVIGVWASHDALGRRRRLWQRGSVVSPGQDALADLGALVSGNPLRHNDEPDVEIDERGAGADGALAKARWRQRQRAMGSLTARPQPCARCASRDRSKSGTRFGTS